MAEILLVDDNPADLDLTSEALARGQRARRVSTVTDGVEAIAFLQCTGKYAGAARPDLVVLDLNLPRKDGRAVLAEVKSDPVLRKTPVVVFSTSRSGHDILESYRLGANSYVAKPGELHAFLQAVEDIENFWFGCSSPPPRKEEK